VKEPLLLHRNEELYQTVFENSADAIFVLDKNLRIIETNQAACDRLKYAKEELLEMSAIDINAPESRPVTLRLAEQLRLVGAARGEVIHVTRHGDKIPVEVNSRQITLNGAPVILTVARDISDRKRVEERLLQSQQHFHLLFENSGTSNSFFNLQGYLVLCNHLCASLLGFSHPDQAVGKSLQELFGQTSGDLFKTRLTKAADEKKVQIHLTEFSVGLETKWLQTSYIPLISENTEVVGVQLISQDITEQKRAEIALNAINDSLERQVRDRTRHLEVVLVQLQEAQNSIVENEKLAVLGRLSASVAHEVNNPLAAIQSSIGIIRTSLDSTLGDGFRVYSSMTAEARLQFRELLTQTDLGLREMRPSGARAARLKLLEELTRRGIAEPEVLVEALGQLGIQTLDGAWAPLLSQERSAEIFEVAVQVSGLFRSTNIIATATAKATEFIRALRKFAYKETTLDSPEWFDLAGNIETVLLLLKSQLHSEVELVRDYASRPMVLGFPNLLLQVWSNLIQNAIQAMEDQGVLTIGIRVAGSRILVEITDTGKGIPEPLRDKIFEPFFTTKDVDKGTGLGLGIVKDALTQNRGFLEFDSMPGKTTFRASLPLESQE